MIDKIASNLLSSSKVIDIYLRTTEQTGMNFLTNNTVQQYLMPFDLQTNEEREKAASIIKVLASSRSIVSPYIDDMFVYADNQWVYKS
jgi:two-component system response regulator YesN